MTTQANPVSNPNPKQRFLEVGQWVNEHRQLIDSGPFIRAADYAVMYYSHIIAATQSKDPNMAGICGTKLAGALEFLEVLRNLSEKPTPQIVTPIPSLNHRA